jgi:superfamily II DNA or RNA helicase
MGKLADKFQGAFSEACQAAGESLRQGGALAALRAGRDSLQAEITDANTVFEIKCWLHDKRLFFRCDCAEAKTGKACAHLWAALLTADATEDFEEAAKRTINKIPVLWNAKSELPMPKSADPVILVETASENRDPAETAGAVAPRLPDPLPELQLLPEDTPQPSHDFALVVQVTAPASVDAASLRLRVFWASRKPEGGWAALRPIESAGSLDYPDEFARFALRLLARFQVAPGKDQPEANLFEVPPAILAVLLPPLALSRRLFLAGEKPPLAADNRGDWRLAADFTETRGGWSVQGCLRRHEERLAMADCLWLAPNGLFLTRSQLGRLDLRGAFALAVRWHQDGETFMLAAGAESLVQQILRTTQIPAAELPASLVFPTFQAQPAGHLYFRPAKFKWRGVEWLHAELTFDYGGVMVDDFSQDKLVVDKKNRRLIPRDWETEYRLREMLLARDFRHNDDARLEELGWKLLPRRLDEVVRELLGHGWQIIAEGKTWRIPQEKQLLLTAGNDWFELQGGLTFNGEKIPLPQLLEALKADRDYVILGDGSYGILPLDWLVNYTMLSEFGAVEGEVIRFSKSQVHLLNALLEKNLVDADAAAEAARQRLLAETRWEAMSAPEGFQGTLRHYQEIGLGWLRFLEKSGFGGCLADDMGLGKTIQVLALLQSRKNAGAGRPTLLVLPRSLIFNWQQEAAKFTPGLQLHLHVGHDRMRRLPLMARADLVLTTYGTLRRDAAALRHFTFDYCILDEAQAVKNPGAAGAKAVRLIRADHRLAMTGTPVENSLGDLLSLFEFLNPGLLHYASVFKRLGGQGRTLSPADAAMLRQAVAPLILRRTKQQAAPELPPKTEQVVWCEMTPAQRHHYDELRHYYQGVLLKAESEMAPAKIEVLEALLRLRQAACHPGLIDEKYLASPSGKVEEVVERLAELIAEDHKVLVFSQFVRFLRHLQERLAALGIGGCYLDGQTIDRQGEVERFQTDPTAKVFLISLKAGGVGLNLTAADYVFLVDPWWNPAAENQAIDRAFRIGQTRQVFAYRFITRGTVEEKVLAMQAQKRAVADAIVRETGPVPAELFTSDSLRFLLE